MKKVSILVACFVVTGCAFLPLAEKIASGVEKYCQEPYSFRSIYRNTVNAGLVGTGHAVHVHCNGDPNATP